MRYKLQVYLKWMKSKIRGSVIIIIIIHYILIYMKVKLSFTSNLWTSNYSCLQCSQSIWELFSLEKGLHFYVIFIHKLSHPSQHTISHTDKHTHTPLRALRNLLPLRTVRHIPARCCSPARLLSQLIIHSIVYNCCHIRGPSSFF